MNGASWVRVFFLDFKINTTSFLHTLTFFDFKLSFFEFFLTKYRVMEVKKEQRRNGKENKRLEKGTEKGRKRGVSKQKRRSLNSCLWKKRKICLQPQKIPKTRERRSQSPLNGKISQIPQTLCLRRLIILNLLHHLMWSSVKGRRVTSM